MKKRTNASQKKIELMRIALNLAGVSCDSYAAEIIVRVIDGMRKKKGEFNMSDAHEIEWDVREKHKAKQLSFKKTTESLIEELTTEIKKLRENATL